MFAARNYVKLDCMCGKRAKWESRALRVKDMRHEEEGVSPDQGE